LTRLAQRLQEHAAAAPARLAFRFLPLDAATGAVDVTYGEMAARVARLAAGLVALGLRGERALLLHEPGRDFIETLFACLHAGVVAVPVAPSLSGRLADRVAGIRADAEAAVALGGATAPDTVAPARCLTPQALLDAAADHPVPAVPDAHDIAVLQYTSGSTSEPRGVVLDHANLEANSDRIAEAFGYGPDLRGVSWLPPYHDMGLIGCILQPVWMGGGMLLMDPSVLLRRPARWLRAIGDFRATTTCGPNFAYELCVSRVRDAEMDGVDLSRCRTALVGAEPVRPSTLRRFAERFRPWGFSPDAFAPCYGLAESTLIVTGGHPGRFPRTIHLDGVELCSVGRPVSGHDVRVLDPETAEPLPDGRVGEIAVAGPSVARGYFQREVESRAAFAASGLRTGDLGTFRDGELYVVGRLKDVVIVNGRKVHSADVEAVVRECAPALRDGASVAFADACDGLDHLIVVHELGRGADRAALEATCRGVRQAVFQALGLSIETIGFVRPLSLPRTSSGKVQRARCRTRWRDGELEPIFVSDIARPNAAPTQEQEGA
jgi:acyl-CoA synthetase (AMP-forming)/AMP-acid ligase II